MSMACCLLAAEACGRLVRQFCSIVLQPCHAACHETSVSGWASRWGSMRSRTGQIPHCTLCSSYPITRWHRLQGVPDEALRLSAMWFAAASAVVGCGIVLFNRQRVDNVSVTLRRVLYHRPTSNSE
jgi:hypothetical protein